MVDKLKKWIKEVITDKKNEQVFFKFKVKNTIDDIFTDFMQDFEEVFKQKKYIIIKVLINLKSFIEGGLIMTRRQLKHINH